MTRSVSLEIKTTSDEVFMGLVLHLRLRGKKE